MKKITVLVALVLFALANTASAAWIKPDASGTVQIDAGKVATGLKFTTKVSANVEVSYNSDTTNGTFYTLATFHTSGTKSYATGSGESRIFMAENTTNDETNAKAAPSAAVSPDWTGWTPVK